MDEGIPPGLLGRSEVKVANDFKALVIGLINNRFNQAKRKLLEAKLVPAIRPPLGE